MKKNEKQMILVLIIITIIVIAVLVNVRKSKPETSVENNTDKVGTSVQTNQNKNETEEFVEVLGDGTKLNVSNKLTETKKIDNYEISNIQLTEQNGKSLILADVKNISSSKVEMKFAKIVLLDKEGNEITTMDAIIGDIEPGGTVQLNVSATTDFSNAYDFTMTINE